MFKGSSRYTAEEIAQEFDGIGGELNAATSKEYVVVYGRFLNRHLERALDVLVDMLLTPTFADLDRERQVVLEEIAMYEDAPQDLIHDLFAQQVFGDHPLGHAVLGTRNSIAEMPEKQIRAYHHHHFALSDMVVAAAGDIDHDELRELLLSKHNTHNGHGTLRPVTDVAWAPRTSFLAKDTEQMHVCLGGPGMARNDERRYALSVMDGLFGGSLSSRLFQEVREKRGLVYSIFSFAAMYRETGLMGVYFGCRPERLVEVMDTVRREIGRLRDQPVGEEELIRSRDHLKGRIILGLESTSSRMTRLGRGQVTQSEILSLDEIAARIDAVTTADIQSLAEELLDPDCLTITAIGADEDVFRAVVQV